MTAAIVVLASTLAASIVALALVIRALITAKNAETGAIDSEATEHIEHGETRLKLERSEFELDATRKALTAMATRAETLVKELAHAMERSSLGAGLKPDDVDGRLLQAARNAEAETARGPLHPDPGASVPVDRASSETGAGAVPRHIDVLR